MDKDILHSLLEASTITVGSKINMAFADEFAHLNGDYTVTVSKVGRGRGGSRVMEARNIATGEDLVALEIDGRSKYLGTAVSEMIASITIGDKTYGGEEAARPAATPKNKQPRAKREAKTSTPDGSAGRRLASVLGGILSKNPAASFKLVGRSVGSPVTGEWSVQGYDYDQEAGTLRMSLISLDAMMNGGDAEPFEFDSTIHGADVKDASLVEFDM